MTTVWVTVLVSVGVSLAEPAASATRPAGVTRADIALAYQRFEEAFAARPLDGEPLIDANLAFEAVTKDFFRLDLASAIAKLHQKSFEMTHQRSPSPHERFLSMLKVVMEPPILVAGSNGPTIRLQSLYSDEGAEQCPVEVILRQGDQSLKAVVETPIIQDGQVAGEATLTSPAEGWYGTWTVELSMPGGPAFPTGRRVIFVKEDLDQVRERNRAHLDKLSVSDELAANLAAVKARNELLKMSPSEALSREFLADYNVLVNEIDREIADLADGKNPFQNRRGDYWRIVPSGSSNIPMRVYVPDGLDLSQSVPLVIALHGAGGDENMFMDAYGLGAIKKQAEAKGFIVVSPATFFFTTRSDHLKAVLDAMKNDYLIDTGRVHVLGHSMGGGATAKLAAEQHSLVRSAACIAGFRGFPKDAEVPPTLVISAELDAIVPKDAIKRAADEAIAGGLPVEYREVAHFGHTIVVQEVLPDVIDWLFRQ